MKSLFFKCTFFSVMFIFFLASCSENKKSEDTSEGLTESITNDVGQLSSEIPKAEEIVDKKLDFLLSKLVKNSNKSLQKSPENIDPQLSIKNGMVAIEITYDQQQVTKKNKEDFNKLGGQIDTVFLNKLYGWVPINKIRLAAQPAAIWNLSAAIKVAYPAIEKDKSTDKKPKSANTNNNGEGSNEKK